MNAPKGFAIAIGLSSLLGCAPNYDDKISYQAIEHVTTLEQVWYSWEYRTRRVSERLCVSNGECLLEGASVFVSPSKGRDSRWLVARVQGQEEVLVVRTFDGKRIPCPKCSALVRVYDSAWLDDESQALFLERRKLGDALHRIRITGERADVEDVVVTASGVLDSASPTKVRSLFACPKGFAWVACGNDCELSWQVTGQEVVHTKTDSCPEGQVPRISWIDSIPSVECVDKVSIY